MKLQLPQVTLIAVTSVKIYETIRALTYSMQGIDFGEVVLVTHKKPFGLPKGITYKHTDRLTDIDRFNYLIAYELGSYVNTDYVILVHYDGFIVHPEMWRKEFLDYDYIGSPWPLPTAEHSTIMMRMATSAEWETVFPFAAGDSSIIRKRQALNGSRQQTGFIMKIFSFAV